MLIRVFQEKHKRENIMAYDINKLLDINNKHIRIEFINQRTDKVVHTEWYAAHALPMLHETVGEINKEHGEQFSWIGVRQ